MTTLKALASTTTAGYVMSEQKRNKLRVHISYPEGVSRYRLMEVLSEALYKPDVNLFDPMPEEEYSTTINFDDISFEYANSVVKDNADSDSE